MNPASGLLVLIGTAGFIIGALASLRSCHEVVLYDRRVRLPGDRWKPWVRRRAVLNAQYAFMFALLWAGVAVIGSCLQ